jgi:predicted transposase YbfD/YdcC
MDIEKIIPIVHAEWKKNNSVHIPRDSKRIHQGTELMKTELRRKINDVLSEDNDFLTKRQIMSIIESI